MHFITAVDKGIDGLNRIFLIEKVLEHEDALFQKVIDRFIRSDQDTFIDNSVRFLAASKSDYSIQLFSRYDEIRSPYGKSLVCILLGLRTKEEVIPWMIEQSYELKKLYPEENYGQRPRMALDELNARFYMQ